MSNIRFYKLCTNTILKYDHVMNWKRKITVYLVVGLSKWLWFLAFLAVAYVFTCSVYFYNRSVQLLCKIVSDKRLKVKSIEIEHFTFLFLNLHTTITVRSKRLFCFDLNLFENLGLKVFLIPRTIHCLPQWFWAVVQREKKYPTYIWPSPSLNTLD